LKSITDTPIKAAMDRKAEVRIIVLASFSPMVLLNRHEPLLFNYLLPFRG